MKHQNFNLQPFSSLSLLPDLQISGDIARHCDLLTLKYFVEGRLEKLSIPAPSSMPRRRHGLWTDTCLELFLAVHNTARYWEFNLSPAGHWNVYQFAAYRHGMKEEENFTELRTSVMKTKDFLALTLNLDLKRIVDSDQLLEIGISAVIKQLDGDISYWALEHPALQPDFHHRESFVIKL